MWHPPGCGTLTHRHPPPPYPIHTRSPVQLLAAATHVQQASRHTSSSGRTHTRAAHTAGPHRRQGTHANPRASHVLTWATCRYDHSLLTHSRLSKHFLGAQLVLATPPLCEEHGHPQFTMTGSPTLHP